MRRAGKRRLRRVSAGFRILGYAAGLTGAGCMLASRSGGDPRLGIAAVFAMGAMVVSFALVYMLRMIAEWLPDRDGDESP